MLCKIQLFVVAVALVVRATLARVGDKAKEVGTHDHLDDTFATANNLDIVALQFILCALPHISCKHHANTHSLHLGCYVRLTAATLRGVKT